MLPLNEVLLRLGLAFLTGAVLGLERESHGRAAGLRTTILVCVAAAIAMILSQAFWLQGRQSGLMTNPDPARLAAGVLTGMGFLGGGAIVREGSLVRGVTTAAVLWFVTILGLAFGSGHVGLGLIGFCVSLLTLQALPLLEGRVPQNWYADITVTSHLEGVPNQELIEIIQSCGVTVKKTELNYNLSGQLKTLDLTLKFKKNARQNPNEVPQRVIERVLKCEGVVEIKWV